MANIQLNRLIKSRQMRMMSLIGGGLLILSLIVVGLLADAKPKKHSALNQANDLTGIIDESFTEANADSAMTAQQGELESLKTQLSQLTQSMKELREAHNKEALELSKRLQEGTLMQYPTLSSQHHEWQCSIEKARQKLKSIYPKIEC